MGRELTDRTSGLIDQSFDWHTLERIFDSSFIKPIYIWVFLVPILLKISSNIPSTLLIDSSGFEPPFEIHLDIPFSWKCLYFSGVFLFLARLLFICWCPNFVRWNRNAASAITAGVTVQQVRSDAADFLRKAYQNKLPAYDSEEAEKIRALLRQYRANFIAVDTQWKSINKIPYVGELLFDSVEAVSFATDSSGNYIFDDYGSGLFSTTVTIERDQYLKHVCGDLIRLQNVSYPVVRSALSALTIIAILLMILPFLQGVIFMVRAL